MPYAVELSDEADAVFQALPVDLAICVNEELHRLAEAPLAIGGKAHFPYLPKGYLHSFWCACAGSEWYVVAFFEVDVRANRLFVNDFSLREYGASQGGGAP